MASYQKSSKILVCNQWYSPKQRQLQPWKIPISKRYFQWIRSFCISTAFDGIFTHLEERRAAIQWISLFNNNDQHAIRNLDGLRETKNFEAILDQIPSSRKEKWN